MKTNDEIIENPPFTRKGICAECGKSLLLDSEGNSEYDFYQNRRYSTVNYKIDYHFCSRTCMQKKLKKQPLSNDETRATERQKCIEELNVLWHKYEIVFRSNKSIKKERKYAGYQMNGIRKAIMELEEHLADKVD